jgi:alpha-ketoglutarate-dependent taurine dioxygenase
MTQSDIYEKVLSDEALLQHKEVLRRQGYINFVDLPEGFDHLNFVQRFGTLIPQYDGELVWSIKAQERFADVYHSLNNKPLKPHTECYEYTGVPPKYLALWCIKASEDGRGQTTLADGYEFIASLSADEVERLTSHVCRFHSTPGLQESSLGRVAYHPIYDTSVNPQEPILRYSFACLDDGGDPFIAQIRQRMADFFDQQCSSIVYKRNSLLIWDNWRMLHARTGFTDQSRHLKRVWLS